MKNYLETKARELDDELALVAPATGLASFETAFLRLYAQGFQLLKAIQIIGAEIDAWKDFSDIQLKNQAVMIMKKPAARKYLDSLNEELEKRGVASMLEVQMFLTDAIRTPIEDIDSTSALCQKKTTTTTIMKNGDKVERVFIESVDKLKSAVTLIKMKGWEAPTKVDVNHTGGVMVVPMAANMADWEKAAVDSQAKLMKDAVEIK